MLSVLPASVGAALFAVVAASVAGAASEGDGDVPEEGLPVWSAVADGVVVVAGACGVTGSLEVATGGVSASC